MSRKTIPPKKMTGFITGIGWVSKRSMGPADRIQDFDRLNTDYELFLTQPGYYKDFCNNWKAGTLI